MKQKKAQASPQILVYFLLIYEMALFKLSRSVYFEIGASKSPLK